jgi:hypothetical protein
MFIKYDQLSVKALRNASFLKPSIIFRYSNLTQNEIQAQQWK